MTQAPKVLEVFWQAAMVFVYPIPRMIALSNLLLAGLVAPLAVATPGGVSLTLDARRGRFAEPTACWWRR